MLLILSCVVTLISPYDETTDKAITSIQMNVDGLLNRLDRDPVPDYGKMEKEYAAIWCEFDSVYLRNEARPKNSLTLGQLDALKKQLTILEENHKEGKLNQAMLEPARNSLDQTFVAILKLELEKK